MNRYLNRAEKQNMVRLYTIMACAESLVNYYSGKADKDFMKYLKTGITYMKKAMTRRGEFMDEDAKKDWLEQCQKLEPFFVPSINSVKEYQERMKLNDYILMSQDDIYDWWASNIPLTCGRCTGRKKKKCLQYKFLLKFNFPVMCNNPKNGNCPYSYIEAGMEPSEFFKEQIMETENVDYEIKELDTNAERR